MSHLLILIRIYTVCLTEFAGPRNRAPFQTFYVQAGLGHLAQDVFRTGYKVQFFLLLSQKIVQVVIKYLNQKKVSY